MAVAGSSIGAVVCTGGGRGGPSKRSCGVVGTGKMPSVPVVFGCSCSWSALFLPRSPACSLGNRAWLVAARAYSSAICASSRAASAMAASSSSWAICRAAASFSCAICMRLVACSVASSHFRRSDTRDALVACSLRPPSGNGRLPLDTPGAAGGACGPGNKFCGVELSPTGNVDFGVGML